MLKEGLTGLGVIVIALGSVRGYNMAWNNKHIENPTHETHSFATGLTGHVEFTRYADGSQDVKTYPGLGHRLFDSKLYQDLDGDGDVDRIRENGAEWKMNSLDHLLVREIDYGEYKEEFDKADRVLRELIAKYGS